MEPLEVARLVAKYWPEGQWVMAVAIAGAESDWNERNYYEGPRDKSYGLWQINMKEPEGEERRERYHLPGNLALWEPDTNARVAVDMWKSQGWRPWSSSRNGALYKPIRKDGRTAMSWAQEAVAQLKAQQGGQAQVTVYEIQRPVQWRGPVPNKSGGFQRPTRGVVLHIMDGTLWGTDDWFRNHPEAQSSSDYGVGKDGTILQWVDWKHDWKAWAEGSGNPYWVSIENEGHAGEALTPAQLESNAQIVAHVFSLDKVPFVPTDSVGGRGLGWHGMGGAAWGGHDTCLGEPIKKQRAAILARAKELAEGDELSPDDKKWIEERIKFYVIRGVLAALYGQNNAAYGPKDFRPPGNVAGNVAAIKKKVGA